MKIKFKDVEIETFVEFCALTKARGDALIELAEEFVEVWSLGGGFGVKLHEAMGLNLETYFLYAGDARRIVEIVENRIGVASEEEILRNDLIKLWREKLASAKSAQEMRMKAAYSEEITEAENILRKILGSDIANLSEYIKCMNLSKAIAQRSLRNLLSRAEIAFDRAAGICQLLELCPEKIDLNISSRELLNILLLHQGPEYFSGNVRALEAGGLDGKIHGSLKEELDLNLSGALSLAKRLEEEMLLSFFKDTDDQIKLPDGAEFEIRPKGPGALEIDLNLKGLALSARVSTKAPFDVIDGIRVYSARGADLIHDFMRILADLAYPEAIKLDYREYLPGTLMSMDEINDEISAYRRGE